MLQRRRFLCGLASASVLAVAAHAQRPVHPIARPPGRRPGGSTGPGRFGAAGGVATGASPGIYAVVAVDTQADTLQLRDDTGRTGLVHVNERSFDLSSLQPGDEVEVDFPAPDPGSTRLEAGALWKVQR